MNNSEIMASQPNPIKGALQTSQQNNFIKPTASTIANLFNSKTISTPYQSVQQPMHDSQNIQKQQVFMTKSELRQFTRKCAEEKVRFQAQIERLSEEINLRDQRIQSLQHKVYQLKQQEQYLITAIEDLRDKHVNIPASDIKIGKVIRLKQDQIDYLNKEVSKFKQWLREEKQEAFRCMECVKMKDRIIDNLQCEIEKLRAQIRPKLKKRKTEGVAQINKSIVIEQQSELAKYKRKSKQLQTQVFELASQIDNLRNSNAILKLQNAKANKNSQPQIESPVILKKHKVESQTRDQQNRKSVVYANTSKEHQKYKLLSCKTYQLEMEIQKLMTQIVELKQQNQRYSNPAPKQQGKHKREISFSMINNNEQVGNQQHFSLKE